MPYFGIPIRNGLPIGLGSVAGFGISPFDPSQLFSAGEQGAWYDPSDFSTLFEDAAGTLPITAIGAGSQKFVGLMLDKSKGLVLGPELVTNGTNLTTTTGWTNQSATLSAENGALKVVTTGSNQGASQVIPIASGKRYKISVTVVASGAAYNILMGSAFSQGQLFSTGSQTSSKTYSWHVEGNSSYKILSFYAYGAGTFYFSNISVRELPGNHATSTGTNRPELSARYNLLVATDTLSTQSVTTAATGYTLSFGGAGSITLSGTATGTYSAGTHSITATAGSLTLTVTGAVTTADLRPASQATGLIGPTYQRVVDANTYDTAGFLPYLRFDGVDDSMSTGSIDFSAGDKMTVWAGVRKLSDATNGCITELSAAVAANNGSFAFFTGSPVAATAQYHFTSRGTAASNVNQAAVSANTFTAPITNVITGTADIAGDLTTFRANGAANGTSGTGDQGSGNYGNYPLFIGRRNNTSFPFNGWLTSLIIRGAQSTQSQIEATEAWVAGKTGVSI